MREQKMASYILLKLKYGNMTIEDADEALDRCIRENDIRGISPEGELYLILTQADDKALPIILERLKRNGFEGKVLDVPETGKETAGSGIMTKTVIGNHGTWAIHLIICILIWSGIRTGFLKAKMYMLSLAVFVPVWGPVCVLLIHFQLFSGTDQVKTVGVEKLRVNEEIYKNMFPAMEENDRDVVPLERPSSE